MNNFDLTFWGYFKNKEVEQKYLTDIIKDLFMRNRVAILVAGLGYWSVIFGDYAKMGLTSGFYMAGMLRTIFLLFCIVSYFIIRNSTSLKTLFNLTFAVAFSSSILILGVVYFLNPDKVVDFIDTITIPLVTVLVYIFINVPVGLLIVNGVFISFVYLFMLIYVFTTSSDTIINEAAILVVINFMGIYLNRFLNINRRKEFAHKITIGNLNENLKAEVEERKSLNYQLEKTLGQITDSIKYAQKIQMALLPSYSSFKESFKDFFIIFKPKNIVSGDFYWVQKIDNKTVIAAADCTGHGISGAFMSVLGISLLNEIVKSALQNHENISANEVLDKLRTGVITSLQQSGKRSERRDGMDISLIIFDRDKKTLQFAGANNAVWISRNKQGETVLEKLDADKMPIGIFTKTVNPFNKIELKYNDNDIIYLFTDGFKDQFGGDKGRKFLSKNLIELLISIHNKPLKEQEKILNTTFDNWKGTKYQQLDDVLIMGIKL